MAKTGRGSDQFPLRLPEGLRDRIKKKAEGNGRSMNEEIVRALEIDFPEPVSIAARLDELQNLFSALAKVRGFGAAVDVLTEEIVSTMESGAVGQDPSLDEAAQAELLKAVRSWGRRKEKEWKDRQRLVDEKYRVETQDN